MGRRGGNDRGRGSNQSRRGGRDYAAPRGGKKIFDRKTTPGGHAAPEDNDPEREYRDEAAAETMAYNDVKNNFESRNRDDAPPRDNKPEVVEDSKISVEAYLKSLESQSVHVKPAAASADDHASLTKEMAESGYKPLEKSVEETGRQPGSAIKPSKQKERQGMHLFEAVPMPPVDLGNGDRRSNDRGGRDNRNFDDNRVPAPATPAPTTSSKPSRPLKDD